MVEDGAFECCFGLKSVIIPDSIAYISDSAFELCPNVVITAPKGSYAIEYAKNNFIGYEEI